MSHRARNASSIASSSSVTISASDLALIRFEATEKLSRQLRGASPARASPRGSEDPVARKARMQALDMERLRAKVESGGADEEKVVALTKTLARHVTTTAPAIRMLSEERKGLVVLELDKQIERKKAIEASERADAAAAHLLVLEAEKAARARDTARSRHEAAKRASVQEAIQAQLAERETRRIIEEEAKFQEGELLLAAGKRAEAAAFVALEKKKAAAREAAAATAEANRVFKERDEQRRAASAAEDAALLRAQAEADATFRAAEARAAEEKAAKEALFNKMRANQQRVSDNRDAEDEARAQRAVESVVLAERARARAAAAAAEERKRDVAEALALQVRIKAERIEEERRRDRAEAAETVRFAAEIRNREAGVVAARRQRAEQAMADLVEQKRAADAAKATELRRPLEERAAQKLVEEAQKRVVEDFRARIVPRMQKSNLPSTFVQNAARVSNGLL